jgi:hypothetical protein
MYDEDADPRRPAVDRKPGQISLQFARLQETVEQLEISWSDHQSHLHSALAGIKGPKNEVAVERDRPDAVTELPKSSSPLTRDIAVMTVKLSGLRHHIEEVTEQLEL